ncbi:Precorrin-3B methylase [Haloferula chungangensis]|uniref:Precorrin-3B methylase n=1 Tax=Haloferula chungangensis TaxID=1048331 RepID=A0ABW2L9S5_9BACT
MATKKHKKRLLVGGNRIKEVNRLIRLARTKWNAHENAACRRERERAMALYETLEPDERQQVPQVLRVWLRYRSEKYFGEGRKGNGANS